MQDDMLNPVAFAASKNTGTMYYYQDMKEYDTKVPQRHCQGGQHTHRDQALGNYSKIESIKK